MSAIALDRQAAAPRTGGPSMARLVAVELRKMVDTKAGLWLMVAMAVLGLVAAGAGATVLDTDDQTMDNVFLLAATPSGLLLAVVGVMSVTSEWSQRTALTTFTLVPRRGRIAVAKLTAAVVIGVVATVACVVIAVVPGLAFGASGALSGLLVAYTALSLVIGIIGGAAFGMLFLNTPVAIVLTFALPTAWGLLTNLVPSLDGVALWFDQSRTLQPLGESDALTGVEWERVLVSVAVWVLLPLVVGAWRLLRKEIA